MNTSEKHNSNNQDLNQKITPDWQPIRGSKSPAGYAAPAFFQTDRQTQELSKISQIATKVLHDPLLMRQLSDRVYELMLQDIHNQKERDRNYGGRL